VLVNGRRRGTNRGGSVGVGGQAGRADNGSSGRGDFKVSTIELAKAIGSVNVSDPGTIMAKEGYDVQYHRSTSRRS
jgi:hypothetical protein